jgi:hypothetical protein
MKKTTEQKTAAVIAEIKEKLHAIESYMHWLIRAYHHAFFNPVSGPKLF